MAERVPRSEYPLWVKLSLLGVPGRNGLWAFVGLSLAAAVACAVYGFLSVAVRRVPMVAPFGAAPSKAPESPVFGGHGWKVDT